MATIANLYVDLTASFKNFDGAGDAVRHIESIERSTTSMANTVKLAGKAIASAFVVTEIVQAGKEFLDLAGSLTDLSAKTGLSTTALQKLKYAAEQNGGTLDLVTNSIVKMGKGLAEGDKGVVSALGKLGLSFEKVRAMKPEDAFVAIGDAIAGVHDPMAQAALATEIFGKSGADALPMFAGNLKETADQAEKMGLVLSEDVIAAGDQFGDTLGTLMTAGMALIGKVLGPFLPLLQKLADVALVVANAVGVVLGDAIKAITYYGKQAIDWIVDMVSRLIGFAEKIPGVGTVVAALKSGFDQLKGAALSVHEHIGSLGATTESTTRTLNTHKGTVVDVSKAHDGAAKSVKAHTVLSSEQVQVMALLTKAHEHQAAALKMEEAAYQASQQAAGRYIAQLPHAIFQTRSFAGAVAQVSEAAASYQGNLANAEQKTKSFGDTLRDSLKGTLDSIPQTMANAFTGGGNIMGAIKSLASQVGSNIGGVVGSMFGGPFGQKVGEAIGSLAGPLVSLFGKLFGTAGRDAVVKFAASFGGFDTLQAKLQTLGDAGAAFWVKLTQGVGRNNPEQAKKVIEEVEAAFAAQGREIEAQNTQLGTLLGNIQALGGAIDPALTPYLDALREGKLLTQDNLDLIAQLAAGGAPTWQQMEAVAKKYNLTIDQLGPTFQQQRLHASFQELVDDLDLLTRGGGDVQAMLTQVGKDGVLELSGVGSKVQELVGQSLKFGVELPANMRPWIEKLIESGLLVDENKTKITDINSLKFGETMQTTLQDLNKTLREMVELFKDKLPAAINGLPSHVTIDVDERHHRTYDGDPDPTGAEEFHSGTAKVLPFVTAHNGLLPDEVPAILQTGEAVLNRRAAAAVGTHAISELNAGRRGGGGSVTVEKGAIVVNGAQDPERVAEEIMRRLRHSMRLQVA